MKRIDAWWQTKSGKRAYRIAQKFATRAGLTFAGVIGQQWISSKAEPTISGLVHTLAVRSDAAAASALIAGLGAAGWAIKRTPRTPEEG